jgi:Undecaprenyl-phosphate glucose phosphotransferase
MSRVPSLTPLRPREAIAPAAEAVTGEVPNNERVGQRWHNLLRPEFAEKAVLAADVILILAASVVCSIGYSLITPGAFEHVSAFAGVGTIVAVNFTAIMTARQNYHLKTLALFSRQAKDTIVVWTSVYGMLAVVGFTMKISADFSRGSAILFFAGGLTTVLTWRLIIASLISRSLANGSFAKKNIIVIAEQDQHIASRALIELRRYGYFPLKTCEVSRVEIAAPNITASLHSKLAEVIRIGRDEQIEDIYILMDWRHHRTIQGILHALAALPTSVHLVPDANIATFLNYPITNIGGTWTAVLRRTPLSRTERAAKRFFDLGLATAGLLTLLPLMLVTALLIKLDSRGPMLFQQRRNGFNGQPFNIFKFRTMRCLEDGPVIPQATRNDPRVTRLGRWLRRSSIDELPQLINVIRGDMSLVGPRPHATSHNSEYETLIANYAYRHHVKPGLTGWAQVNGYRGETRRIEQMERRVEHDLWYINNWSPLLDLRIILQTIVVTLRQTTAY